MIYNLNVGAGVTKWTWSKRGDIILDMLAAFLMVLTYRVNI